MKQLEIKEVIFERFGTEKEAKEFALAQKKLEGKDWYVASTINDPYNTKLYHIVVNY
jgi:hypothetical protein